MDRKECLLCNKTYNPTYFSSHKKSSRHQRLLKSKQIKEDLLKENIKTEPNSIDILEDIINKLIELKKSL